MARAASARRSCLGHKLRVVLGFADEKRVGVAGEDAAPFMDITLQKILVRG